MAISLSLTHSKTVGLWMQSGRDENKSDSVRRYAIYKFMHRNPKYHYQFHLPLKQDISRLLYQL